MTLPNLARKPVYAPRGAVATSQALAASAGLRALQRGGNAVDAALASAITLTVVQPGSNDIGGDLFAMVWDGTQLHDLNASGRAPAALSLDALAGMPEMPARGWLPVTVPGAPGGWRDLHARFGRLTFDALFEDAIYYAEQGFAVSPTVALHWQRALAAHAKLDGPEFTGWPEVFAPGGHTPGPGERWANPAAGRTLRLIAETGAEAFYTGEIATATADWAARTGGLLSLEDLATHASVWVEPISVRYRGYDVWELPPNGQGVAALLALAILDGLDLAGLPIEARLHAQVEAMKLGFADTHAYVGDPESASDLAGRLLAPEYVASRRALVGEEATEPVPGQPSRGGTVYLCAADAEGMMVSLIQSNYLGFGSFVVVPGYGFGLQNRGSGFTLDQDHPNALGPAKRPFHTIIPGFLTRNGAAVGPFGLMGGHMQPQGHVQLITATVDDGLDPQAALDAPRWYWEAGRRVQVEPELGAAIAESLARRGHEVTLVSDRTTFGNGQVIWQVPDVGYVAGSEARADGYAAGW